MSETIKWTPQSNGFYQGWNLIVGADNAYQAIDDGTESGDKDDDTTYIRLTFQAVGTQDGIVSFPMFLGARGYIPSQILLRAWAKKEGPAASPSLEAGFSTAGGGVALHATPRVVGNNSVYTSETFTFTTNPFTGVAWTADDWYGLEPLIQKMDEPNKMEIRITQFSAEVTYTLARNINIGSDRMGAMTT